MAHILIAEDVEDIRFAYEAIVMAAGHTVETVGTGSDAIAKLHDQKFDIVITDLMMPKGDGFDVADEIEKLDNPPKILVVTGGGDQMSPHAAIKINKSHIDRMLVKPVSHEALLDAIKRLLA